MVFAELCGQVRPAFVTARIYGDVIQPRDKGIDLGLILDQFLDYLAGELAIPLGVHLGSGRTDRRRMIAHLTGTKPTVKRGQDFAAGQISGPAKHDNIKRINGDRSRSHDSESLLALSIYYASRISQLCQSRLPAFSFVAPECYLRGKRKWGRLE